MVLKPCRARFFLINHSRGETLPNTFNSDHGVILKKKPEKNFIPFFWQIGKIPEGKTLKQHLKFTPKHNFVQQFSPILVKTMILHIFWFSLREGYNLRLNAFPAPPLPRQVRH